MTDQIVPEQVEMDEDWLEEVISDSIDMYWRPRDAARLILSRMGEVCSVTAACADYLKDGETPAECIARNRADTNMALEMLAEERAKSAAAFNAGMERAAGIADKHGDKLAGYIIATAIRAAKEPSK